MAAVLAKKPPDEWGEFVRRRILGLGFRPEQVADSLGVARGTVYAWQRSERWPETFTLLALRDVLELDTVDELLEGRAVPRDGAVARV